jgi:hypothetical protein
MEKLGTVYTFLNYYDGKLYMNQIRNYLQNIRSSRDKFMNSTKVDLMLGNVEP